MTCWLMVGCFFHAVHSFVAPSASWMRCTGQLSASGCPRSAVQLSSGEEKNEPQEEWELFDVKQVERRIKYNPKYLGMGEDEWLLLEGYTSQQQNAQQRVAPWAIQLDEADESGEDPFMISKEELRSVLIEQYSDFFGTVNSRQIYTEEVECFDPLGYSVGPSKYDSSKDVFGRKLFQDPVLDLHTISELAPNKMALRWTLELTLRFLPWQPRLHLTGLTVCTTSKERGNRIVRQEDYWDAVNLRSGVYRYNAGTLPFLAWANLLTQMLPQPDRCFPNERPYQLLRLAALYEVRRYSPWVEVSTEYDLLPVGISNLDRYVTGRNKAKARVRCSLPCLTEFRQQGPKTMSWSLKVGLEDDPPEPIDSFLSIRHCPGYTVAIREIPEDTTEEVVWRRATELQKLIAADGLSTKNENAPILANYNIDSFQTLRRNEIWLPLDSHPWQSSSMNGDAEATNTP